MLIRRLRYWLENRKRAAALREEMELHLEEKAAELREAGLDEAAARAEARRRFGNVVARGEESREVWIARWWSEFWQDLRYGWRALSRTPSFTFAAVVALVLGIGANLIVFNVYNTLAFAPWAIRDADQTVQVWLERSSGDWSGVSWPHFRYLEEQTQTLAGLAAFSGNGFRVTDGNVAWDAEVVTTSANYFELIGTGFAAGRGFSATANDERNPVPEAVLQHAVWTTRFGGDPGVVGRSIEVGGQDFQIVGVAAQGFHGAAPSQTDLWLPYPWRDVLRPAQSMLDDPNGCCVSLIGRLGPESTRAAAQAEIDTLSARFFAATAQSGKRVLLTAPSFMANPDRFTLFFAVFLPIGMACLLILMLACANVANLQLARAISRRREFAVRLSLGAGRGRIVRQLFVEGLLLSAIAGGAGLVVSAWVPRWIFQVIAAENLTFRFDNDFRVLLFAGLATLLVAILSGMAPTFRTVVGATLTGLSQGVRTTSSGRLRRFLLVTQVALCAVLVSSTALLVHALFDVRTVDVGFEAENVIVMSPGLDAGSVDNEQARVLIGSLVERIAGLPGVESVAYSRTIPLGADSDLDTTVLDPQSGVEVEVGLGIASARFFETLRIPLVDGRAFTLADEINQDTVILNEAAARRFWPGENPLGKTLVDERPVEVIGVVRGFSTHALGSEQDPHIWLPGSGSPRSMILVRHSGSAEPLLGVLPELALDVDRHFLADAAPYRRTIDGAYRLYDITAATALVLGVLCLLLASVGIYGVAAYNASQQRREFGVRMALGADPRTIVTMVLKQSLRTVMIGLAIGIVGAFGFGRLLAGFLYGVEPADPWAMLVTIVILAGTAAMAVLGPALRSSRVDPAITLRHE